ncbi:GNAT family N-acetyltransferase [Bacteroides sp. 51]|uniref:GNAT family N-acetyltransferase n=1 Tax=Bacteroides sp. 51 TaxID=2302938 RepID=UPI001EF29514|nr:N-acetyltransferase [Bacteroides sp. 51]
MNNEKHTEHMEPKINIQIRETQPEDYNDIIQVEYDAFGGREDVVGLVKDLLADETSEPRISLMAFYQDKPIGHILFTKAYFSEGNNQILLHILAPLAVIPEFQNKGVGGLLIKEGIKRLKMIGSKLVFVLGHADYYPRHGFIPNAAPMGYPAPYPIPAQYDNCWMVQPLSENGLNVGKGKIGCAKAMDAPEHWTDDEHPA